MQKGTKATERELRVMTSPSEIPAKKLSVLYILTILRRFSDPEHPLSQQQILTHLQEDYGMVLDRKAVKRNLVNLLEAGYPLGYKPWQRKSASREKVENVYGSWYYEHEFAPVELTTLIDGLLFSHLPARQVEDMIQKLLRLQSRYYTNPTLGVHNIPNESWLNWQQESPANAQMLYSLAVLNEAIETQQPVVFHYLQYGPDKQQRPRVRRHRKRPHRYRVSPYAVVATNGRFYLIGNTEGHDDISHYRVDRMQDVRIEKNRELRPLREVTQSGDDELHLPKHLAEHVNMFAGPAVPCLFRCDREILDAVMDDFGTSCTISEVTDKTVVVGVTVNATALFHWSLQFGPAVKVLAPASLVHDLQRAAIAMADAYRHEEPLYFDHVEMR